MSDTASALALRSQIEAVATWDAAGPAFESALAIINHARLTDTDTGVRTLVSAMADCVLRLTIAEFSIPGGPFHFVTIPLPPLLARWGVEPANRDAWRQVRDTERAFAAQNPASLLPALRLLAIEGVTEGPALALAGFLDRVADRDFAARFSAVVLDPRNLGATLGAHGWYAVDDQEIGTAIDRIVDRLARAQDPDVFASVGRDLAGLLDYSLARGIAWLDFLTHRLMIPQVRAAALDARLASHALKIEQQVYHTILKKRDTAENFRRTYEALGPALTDAGRAFGRALPPLTARPPPASTSPPPRVGFFLMGDFSTAHAQLLYHFLRAHAQLAVPTIAPIVLIWERPGPNLEVLLRSLESCAVVVHHPLRPLANLADAVAWLRDQVAADGIEALVFVSVVMTMCFAAAVPVAPVHIWWSMKYHALKIDEIQGYLTHATRSHRSPMLGPHWRIGEPSMPYRFEPGLAGEAAAIRRRYAPGADIVVLGCLGRAEKLLDPSYAAMLGRVMRAHPNTVYLWTGRSAPEEFTKRLAAEGIASRCHHVGWVNVRLFVHVLDIKLDSFPFASGHTSVEMMAAAKPVVTLITPESRETSTVTSFLPLHNGTAGTPSEHDEVRAMFCSDAGESLVPYVETVADYERFAARLIGDPEFRSCVGVACRAFVHRFLSDDRRFAETMSAHMVAIIRDVGRHDSGVVAP